MKRATITIPDDLEAQIDAHLASQEAPKSLAALIRAALRRYLAQMQLGTPQYRPVPGPLRITPAVAGSGRTDVSAEHDRELADAG